MPLDSSRHLACASPAGLERGVTCLATQEGALLVQISRELFLSFLATQPKALQVYLQKVRG